VSAANEYQHLKITGTIQSIDFKYSLSLVLNRKQTTFPAVDNCWFEISGNIQK